MSKKINSSGKYLNITNLSNYQLQYYGKTVSLYKQNFLTTFVLLPLVYKKLFINKTFLNITTLNLISFNNCTFLFLSFSELNKKNIQCFLLFYENIISSTKINIYLKKNFYLTSAFIKNYIFYLNIKYNYPPKKIFNFLILFLKNSINCSTVFLTSTGLNSKKLIGFKLQLKGRYETTKNSMSKVLVFKVGKINSTKLNSSINFLHYTFYTKLGVSNLKIWLFYKLKDNA